MFARFASALIGLAMVSTSAVSLADKPMQEISTTKDVATRKLVLSNGLEVFIVEDHHVPNTVVELRYRVGRRDDPADRRGLAQVFKVLFEHPSTRHMRDFARADALHVAGAPNGIKTTVFVGDDGTHLTTQVPSHLTELALFLEADRMGFSADWMTPEMVEYAVKEAVRIDGEEQWNAFATALSMMEREQFGSAHAYSRIAPDLPLEIDDLTAREVLARKHEAYGPGNATLVVMGDIDAARVEAQVRRYFEPLLRTPRLAAPGRNVATRSGEKRITLEANIPAPQMIIGWPTAAFYTADDIALDVVARILRERLYQKLTVEKKATSLTGARQASRELGSYFYVTASAAAGHDLPEIQKLLEEEIRNISTNPPSQSEMSRSTNEFVTSLSLGHITLRDRSHQMVTCFHAVGDPSCYDEYIAGYSKLRPADVQNAAAKYLHPTNRLVGIIVPNKDAPVGGRVVGEKAK